MLGGEAQTLCAFLKRDNASLALKSVWPALEAHPPPHQGTTFSSAHLNPSPSITTANHTAPPHTHTHRHIHADRGTHTHADVPGHRALPSSSIPCFHTGPRGGSSHEAADSVWRMAAGLMGPGAPNPRLFLW